MKSDKEGRLVNRSNIYPKSWLASLFKGPISTQTSIFYQLWLFILARHSGSMVVDRGVIILQSYQILTGPVMKKYQPKPLGKLRQ